MGPWYVRDPSDLRQGDDWGVYPGTHYNHGARVRGSEVDDSPHQHLPGVDRRRCLLMRRGERMSTKEPLVRELFREHVFRGRVL